MDEDKAVRDLSGKMFVFPQETATAHVRLTPTQNCFSAVTVCQRIFTDVKRQITLFSLATPSVANGVFTSMNISQQTLDVYVQDSHVSFEGVKCERNKWHSICTTWDSVTGLVQMWLDGQPLAIKYISENPLAGKPIIILGQDQDSYGGGFAANQSTVGMMTDVHMWDRVLSPHEIQRFMKDQSFTPGNVLNWAALDCEIKGRVVIANKQTCCSTLN